MNLYTVGILCVASACVQLSKVLHCAVSYILINESHNLPFLFYLFKLFINHILKPLV